MAGTGSAISKMDDLWAFYLNFTNLVDPEASVEYIISWRSSVPFYWQCIEGSRLRWVLPHASLILWHGLSGFACCFAEKRPHWLKKGLSTGYIRSNATNIATQAEGCSPTYNHCDMSFLNLSIDGFSHPLSTDKHHH